MTVIGSSPQNSSISSREGGEEGRRRRKKYTHQACRTVCVLLNENEIASKREKE
jgi:hypothetical protein